MYGIQSLLSISLIDDNGYISFRGSLGNGFNVDVVGSKTAKKLTADSLVFFHIVTYYIHVHYQI